MPRRTSWGSLQSRGKTDVCACVPCRGLRRVCCLYPSSRRHAGIDGPPEKTNHLFPARHRPSRRGFPAKVDECEQNYELGKPRRAVVPRNPSESAAWQTSRSAWI